MDLGFAAVNNPEEWGDDSPTRKVVETTTAAPSTNGPSPASVPSAGAAIASVGSISAPTAGTTRAGPPASKMHNNPATRYFIIKCNSHNNLVASIQNNVWATQKHNNQKLNEALRVSPYVILLFSVNMSGSFQGYARMCGRCGESQAYDPFKGFGALFDIKWLKLHDLDFGDLQHVTNEWNQNLCVKISRDGQELPNRVGKQICDLIDKGVFQADPEHFIEDDELANPVPADAPAIGEPIFGGDTFHGGGKGGMSKGGYGRYGNRGGGYGGGHHGSANGGGSYGRNAPYHGANTYGQPATGQHTTTSSYGGTTVVGSSWGTTSSSTGVSTQPQYAAAWGAKAAPLARPVTTIISSSSTIASSSTGVPLATYQVVTTSAGATGNATGAGANASSVQGGAATVPVVEQLDQPKAADRKVVAAPDFVNMSYDQ